MSTLCHGWNTGNPYCINLIHHWSSELIRPIYVVIPVLSQCWFPTSVDDVGPALARSSFSARRIPIKVFKSVRFSDLLLILTTISLIAYNEVLNPYATSSSKTSHSLWTKEPVEKQVLIANHCLWKGCFSSIHTHTFETIQNVNDVKEKSVC